MGLKSFLAQQGFIKAEPEEEKPVEETKSSSAATPPPAATVMPTYFPVNAPAASTTASQEPSFVSPLAQMTSSSQSSDGQPDPSFVKFFEDELTKANFPGPDYFEFRQQLLKTQQKMAAKGMAAPDVILQAVLMNFDTQGIPTSKLVETAQRYKDVVKQKKEEFLKGAEAEKNNQLQKRQTVLQTHDDNIKKLQAQLQQLEQQRKQLDDALNKEKTQADVDKNLGKEAIEKIERAQRLINSAHDHMQGTIDDDIKRLQSV